MDIYKQKFTKLQNELISFLCIYSGKSFSGRELARKLKVSPTAVSKSIKLLKKEKIVELKKDFLLQISLNVKDEKIRELKRLKNIELIYSSRLVDHLKERLYGTVIILFGSYAFGEDLCGISDIDIAVIGRDISGLDLNIFEKKLKRKINLQFFEDQRKISENLRYNIFNGYILHGRL